jgi:hypothetical protein
MSITLRHSDFGDSLLGKEYSFYRRYKLEQSREVENSFMQMDDDDLQIKSNIYLLYAVLGCICFGSCTFLQGDLGGRLGIAGAYPFFIGNFICWGVYHILK